MTRRTGTGRTGRRVSIFTVGHSNQDVQSLIETLAAHGVERVADVRRHPASRRHPQFTGPTLAASLAAAGIDYMHLPALGGRRTPRRDSQNSAWRNASFRGYADYMETPAFGIALGQLIEHAAARPTAIMCAERLWWQCHRALIADALKARGHEVIHILSTAKREPHPYTSAARIVDGSLTYRGLL